MSEPPERVRGIVLWFAEERGWGLVRDERGRLYHLDYVDMVGDGLHVVSAGQAVEFEPRSRSGRAVATRLVALDATATQG